MNNRNTSSDNNPMALIKASICATVNKLEQLLDDGIQENYKQDQKEFQEQRAIISNMDTLRSDTKEELKKLIDDISGDKIQAMFTRIEKEKQKKNFSQIDLFIIITQSYKRLQIIAWWVSRILSQQEKLIFHAHFKQSSFDLFLQQFKQKVLQQYNEQIVKSIQDLINQGREDRYIPKQELKTAIQIYRDIDFADQEKIVEFDHKTGQILLTKNVQNKQNNDQNPDGCYKKYFENQLLITIKQNYQQKIKQYQVNLSSHEQIKTALNDIIKEQQQCQFYPESTEAVINLVTNIFLERDYIRQLLLNQKTGLEQVLNNLPEKNEELRDFFQFCKKSEVGLKEFNVFFSQWLVDLGKSKVNKIQQERIQLNQTSDKNSKKDLAKIPSKFYQEMNNLYNNVEDLLKNNFENNQKIFKSVQEAFKIIFIQNDKVQADMAKWCDDLLKDRDSQQQLSTELNNYSNLMNFVQQRDTYIEYYKLRLAERLLSFKNINFEGEFEVLNRLSVTNGMIIQTPKLRQMIEEIQYSEEYISFKKKEKGLNFLENIKFYAISRGLWPLKQIQGAFEAANTKIEQNLPEEIKQKLDQFKNIYKNDEKNGQKKLDFLFNQGNCEINMCSKEKFSILTSTYGMLILLRFNQKQKLSFVEIQELTQINNSIIKQNLDVFVKSSILIQIGEDSYEFNQQLQLTKEIKKRSINCFVKPDLQKKNSEDEQLILEQIKKERKMKGEAVVVRIMKSKKQLLFNQLVEEIQNMVSKNVKYNPDLKDIKEWISSMIEQEFVKRDEQNIQQLQYIP